LAETGREQVLFLLPHSEVKERHYSEEERWDGIRQNSQRLNLRQPVRYRMKTWFETDWRCSTETYEPAVEELTRLLRDRPDCDAVIVDFRVMGIALSEALRRLGREMPRDIGVIQINPFNTLDIGFPATTTIGLDFERLGEVIIETLADGIDKGSWGEPITFPLTLYPRDTT
jgi:DNA-binding LacI/PurR family transcriptional regulator